MFKRDNHSDTSSFDRSDDRREGFVRESEPAPAAPHEQDAFGGVDATVDQASSTVSKASPAHAAVETGDPEKTTYRDSYHDYYNQPYDDTKAGPDALSSLEPMKTTNFQPVAAQPGRQGRGSHAKPPMSERQRKSRRMRRILIVVIALLVVLMGALAFLAFQLIQESKSAATQQVQQQGTQAVEQAETEQGETSDAQSATVRTTEVPLLTAVIGMTQDEAVASIGHGAVVSGTMDVNEEGNPIKQRLTIALTDEPADTRSGTPTVYLGLNEEGRVVMAGYSAATASLGYGTLSFADAVQSENIVEKTLDEAGLSIPAGTVELPEDRASYCTYASDGTTLVKESCEFSGEAEVNGVKYTWSSLLTYNYTAANASGNLADTIRQIYVYINAA